MTMSNVVVSIVEFLSRQPERNAGSVCDVPKKSGPEADVASGVDSQSVLMPKTAHAKANGEGNGERFSRSAIRRLVR